MSLMVASWNALITLFTEGDEFPLSSEELRLRTGYVNKTHWRKKILAGLEDQGFARMRPDQTVRLTKAGKEEARRLMLYLAEEKD